MVPTILSLLDAAIVFNDAVERMSQGESNEWPGNPRYSSELPGLSWSRVAVSFWLLILWRGLLRITFLCQANALSSYSSPWPL